MDVYKRFENFDKEYCWQYGIRQQNLISDLEEHQMTLKEAKNLRISDFNFSYVDKSDKTKCSEIVSFIKKHEWLGKMPIWVTHRFITTYKNKIAGVIIMATPNSFSNLLGAENKNKEKLIARGACISYSPKNLASWLIMQSVDWMVKNTEFRYFTAYSDPEAKEIGTIYQACNFTYLGQTFGSGYQYLDPNNTKRGWFGSSGFADRSQIVRYAKALGIEWQKEWFKYTNNGKYRKVNWKMIPSDIVLRLKQARTQHKESCKKRKSPAKHKYALIKGFDKRETKRLIKIFREINPKLVNLPYPKERGK